MMNAAERIEKDTRALCLEHGRRVGQRGHDIAREYLAARLAAIGLEPFASGRFELPYSAAEPGSGATVEFVNLAGIVRGREPTASPVLIGAHYDSVIDAPCADDNATAVAVVLAAAQALVDAPAARDVVIAILDAEEPPFFLTPAMGSIRFYEDHCREITFACAIVMDLIGHDVETGIPEIDVAAPDFAKLLFVLGSESHAALPSIVEHAASAGDGLRIFPTLNAYIGDMSDHHAFRLGGQPYLFLSGGQGRHYHAPEDTPDWINFDRVRRTYEFVMGLVREMDTAPLDGGARPEDPAPFEIRMIERALGPKLAMLLDLLAVDRLETRADLSRLAHALAGSFMNR